ncbi:phosphoesterase [Tieghemostelium lacteum]|uniref:Phosphoesterase n=1 Tax=Tieghemostelium lacteum TaxID=361077 RepID=A0A151Z8Y1_TIELA|nr:phosphoesterase [Tieghemostelium lacteum]|eukprot:KYQ90294.1 phosphoesterase [Tieghemostelium lacteum]
MGVPQTIDIQNQGTDFKYFHLKEDLTDDLDLIKDSHIPRLSLWGWFTPQHNKMIYQLGQLGKKDSNSLNSSNISNSTTTVESNGASTSISIDREGSDSEDMIQMMDYTKIDINASRDTNSSGSGSVGTANDEEIEYLNQSQQLDGVPFTSTTSSINPKLLPHKFCSPIYSDVTFSLLVAVVCIFSIVYCFLVGPKAVLPAFLVSLLIFISYIFACFSPNNKWYIYSVTVLSVGLGLTIPTFFAATGAVVLGLGRSTWDSSLVSADSSLLGWVFPMGQMGLYVDKSTLIGPDSFIGELSTEILQLSYISYYIWGYFMEVWILFNLWKCSLSKDPIKQQELAIWDQRLKMFICSWISTYFLVFSINLSFPAVSPRVYLRGEYTNQLNGFGFAGFVRRKIEDAAKGSFGSFPSGHIATSWAISFASYRIVPAYGFISGVASFLITIATMYLRYHYFVDFLAAVPVAILCLLYGGFYSPKDFKNLFVSAYRSIKNLFKYLKNLITNSVSKFNKLNDKY